MAGQKSERANKVMALIIQAPDRVAPTFAQQIFVIGSGVAGGLAGFLLAKHLSKVPDVSFPLVAGTTLVSMLATFGAAVYLARHLS